MLETGRQRQPRALTAKPDGLRERKKRATRQLISDIATKLFTERGFEDVSIDEVAAAANVSKMTVFNYFARKEDLFFDRSDGPQKLMREALTRRGHASPMATLQALAHDLVERGNPFVKMSPRTATFWKAVADSPALRTRAWGIAEEVERDLALMLATSIDAPPSDPIARLIAALLVGAWRVAFRDALHRQRSGRATATREAFLELLDRGFAAASAAARGSPYV